MCNAIYFSKINRSCHWAVVGFDHLSWIKLGGHAYIMHKFKTLEVYDTITFKVIDFYGKQEIGEGIGVNRDIFESFWGDIESVRCCGSWWCK